MKQVYNYGKLILTIICVLSLFYCMEKKRDKNAQIIRAWIDKTITLPDLEPVIPFGKMPDSLQLYSGNREYKILLYVDSTGCTQCKLHMNIWKTYMKGFYQKADFMFYFHPKNKEELLYLLKYEKFNRPVYVDTANLLYSINKLPDKQLFHCFLLDRNNKVLAIGNPTENPKIWELYKEIINGKPAEKQPVTTVEADRIEIELKDLQVGKTSEAVFRLTNTGGNPLAIIMVETSCGCTVPEWDKQPVAAGKTTEIKVKITPEKQEFFHKTVTVHCNTEKGRLVLYIKGSVDK